MFIDLKLPIVAISIEKRRIYMPFSDMYNRLAVALCSTIITIYASGNLKF
jgi:hypothetical protein